MASKVTPLKALRVGVFHGRYPILSVFTIVVGHYPSSHSIITVDGGRKGSKEVRPMVLIHQDI